MLRDKALLFDILESAELILEWTTGLSSEEFHADRRTQNAVLHRFAIMGEAAGKLSAETRDSQPELPWGAMIGMRHRIVHGYQDVDLELVWETIAADVPRLAVAVRGLLES